jgi:gliding motility-associated-like protein
LKRNYILVLFFTVALAANLFAQQGINGALTVSAANTVVNEYTVITAFTPAGSTTIPVTASTLNANGRFPGNLQPGDLIMLYQAEGSIINSPPGGDTTWGRIDPGNYYSTGFYEFHQVVSVPNGTSIIIDCGTTHDFIPNAGTARKPEVIRVPRYTSLTINAGGVLTCDDWNGTIGGVLAVEVQGNTVINAGGLIDLSGKGFRGGSTVGDNNTQFGVGTNASTNSALGAEKGEGVAGYQSEYDVFGGRYCMAPGANGGGGGDGHNSGGGGGANAPNSTSGTAYWSGLGIPDQSVGGWTAAWNLEPPINTMSLRTAANSAGGGKGGYSFSANNANATTQGPGNLAAWGGDARNYQSNGLGGRPLDYTTGRLFMGGGGGAGDQNNMAGGSGGDGGGLCYLMVFGSITGSGTVASNGLNGGNATGGTSAVGGIDGAGGGGAGGTIILNAVGGVANTITVNTNAGNGGNQVIGFPFSTNETEGPGGGGGGGYIAVSSGSPTRNSNGGVNGTTNSQALTEFTPNGATKGCPGTNNASITNFTITMTNITICSGNSVTLTAVIGGSPPPGYVIDWYTNPVGGVPFATGASYTTPALFATTTYWVGTCPGWWRVPVTVTVGPAPIVTASASPVSICSGGSTTLTAGGAVTYNWMPGNINGNPIVVSPLVTTTYTVTGTVSVGCSNTAQVTVTVNPTPTVTATASPTTICAGSTSTLTGGGATNYNWNPGNINGSPIVVSPAATTTYTVNGSTVAGCSSTAQVTVTVNALPVVTASASQTTICSGGSTTLTGSGGTTYNWNPGNINGNGIVVSPAVTTTYTVTGTNAAGCTNTAQVTITVNPTPTVTATASPTSICIGGSSTLTGGGATTYNWNPGNINGSPIVVSPAATTTYTVTGTSAGCNSTAQVTVTVSALPVVTASASQTTICAGGSTTLTGSGATTYNWNPGNINGNGIVVSPVATTTYTVTGTNGSGCTNTAQVTITVNPLPVVTASAAPTTICSGSSTTLTGGGASTYNWNPGNINGNGIVVSPVATTTYTVTGTSAAGCANTAQVTVTVNPTPTVTASASPTSICTGGSTTLTGSGATTYNWNPGNINGNGIVVSPAATTTYTVTGTSSGCNSTAQVTVTVNALPVVTASASQTTICTGSSTTLTGSGATTYNWNPGNINGNGIVVSPVATTTYTVTGTNGLGCTNTAQVTITVNPLPVVTASANNATICLGGSSTLTGGGATTYNWNPGNINGNGIVVSPIVTTTYTVTGTSAAGCTNTAQVTVTVNPTPTVTATSTASPICVGNSTTLNASGAITYNWNPGNINGSSVIVSPVATTTYTVTGTDGNGCTSTAQVTITVNPLPTPTATSTPATICVGQSSTLNSSGGVTYVWNGGSLVNANGSSQTDSPNATTTYTVMVTDAAGCSATAQVTLTVNPLPVVTVSNDTTVCSGTTLNLFATGGTTYSWNGGVLVNTPGANQSVNPPSTTTYTVSVTDVNGCSAIDSVGVTVNAIPVVAAGNDVSICPNSSIQLNASGATSYLWTPATGLNFNNISNPVASPTVTTTYVVTGTSAVGCSSTDTVVVTIANNLTVTAGADVTICSGDTIQLSTSGGTIYAWTPSASLQTPNSATTNAFPASTTTYVVNVTDANNCQGSDTVTVFVNGPVALASTGSTTICIGQSATITATPSNGISPYTYSWSNGLVGAGPQTVSPVTTTAYTVSVVDSIGCSSPVQTITVTVNPPLSIANIPPATVCAGTPTTLTASPTGGDGNFSYLWMPGAMTTNPVTVSPLVTTTYTLVVSDGCGTPPDTTMITVTVNPVATLTTTSSAENCNSADGTASVTANGGTSPYTYLWNNNATTSSISGLAAGTYTVTVTDANGCATTQTVIVGSNGNATANAGNTVTIISGDSTQLNGSGSGTTYSWSPPTDLSCSTCPNPFASPTVTTTYTLTVTDSTGCTATDTVTVFVDMNCGDVYLPNAFSPNGDNQNDVFYVRGNCIKYMDFEIYNRWGEKVFESTDPSKGWDGTWRGEKCEAAVFTYFLRATLIDDSTVEQQGNISLVK